MTAGRAILCTSHPIAMALAGRSGGDGAEAWVVGVAGRGEPRGAADPRAAELGAGARPDAGVDRARPLGVRAGRPAGPRGLPSVRDDEPGRVFGPLGPQPGVPGPLAGAPLHPAPRRGRVPGDARLPRLRPAARSNGTGPNLPRRCAPRPAGRAGLVAGDPHPAAGAGELPHGAGERQWPGRRHGPARSAPQGAIHLHAARAAELRGVSGQPVRPGGRRPIAEGGGRARCCATISAKCSSPADQRTMVQLLEAAGLG